MASFIDQLRFRATATADMVRVLMRTGIVSTQGGPRALASMPSGLLRYRFTTAREIEQAYHVCPERLALIDDDGALTYGQLRTQSHTFARYLRHHYQDNIRLGVMARNGRGIIVPLSAKGYAGATIFLLNVGSSSEQLAGCLKECDINILVLDDEFLDRLPKDFHGEVIVAHSSGKEHPFSTLEKILDNPSGVAEEKLPIFPHHGPIVLMSSGTTGIPKGIIRPEPTFPDILPTVMNNMPWGADQKVQFTASIFHAWGWACINLAFGARNTVVTHRVFDPVRVLDDIQRYNLDGLISSPVFYKRMIEADPTGLYDTSSLKFIASSGHALNPQLVEDTIARFGPILANVYGSTEISLAAVANAQQLAQDPTIAGHIAAGTTLRILDDDGNEVPRGEVGEIHLTNKMTLTGYTRPGMEVKKVDGLVSIGDLGYIDPEGMLHVVGRTDDMIIVGGENVHPQSVSEVLESMPGIRDVYAGGVDDDALFKRVAVWVVPTNDDKGAALTEDSIRTFVRDNLADHSVPRDVHFRTELPRNPTGKVVPRLL